MLPRCCNDDFCGKQSSITCEVVCGKQYMIQIGTRPGSPGFAGSIQIDCAGQPCGGGPDPIECDCTGARPPLVNNLTMPFDPGLVSAVTQLRPDPNDPAVVLYDLGGQGAAPVGSNWNTDRYSHPSWKMANLGCVLGVALDDAGNVFVGHTSSYPDFFGLGDTVGTGGPGAIYRLDGATGAVTTVIALPQQVDAAMPANEQYPGLGQLSFDGATQRLFAANFEDGRVYSIDPYNGAGFKVRSTYLHGGAITGALPNAGLSIPNEPRGFMPLGNRIFAVKATQGRLYYSLWTEDAARQSAVAQNEIWSVAFDANGVFQTGTARLEFAVPSLPGQIYSNPVADISFDNNCCMLLSERSFGNPTYGAPTQYPDTTTTAHDARALRWCQGAGGAWSQDLQFQAGAFTGTDSAGGIGYEGIADKVWMLSDSLSYPPGPWIYGLQGMPAAGAPASGSIWVDLDNNFATYQKFQQGSLDVNCLASKPCEFETVDVDCKPQSDGTMDFLWTVLDHEQLPERREHPDPSGRGVRAEQRDPARSAAGARRQGGAGHPDQRRQARLSVLLLGDAGLVQGQRLLHGGGLRRPAAVRVLRLGRDGDGPPRERGVLGEPVGHEPGAVRGGVADAGGDAVRGRDGEPVDREHPDDAAVRDGVDGPADDHDDGRSGKHADAGGGHALADVPPVLLRDGGGEGARERRQPAAGRHRRRRRGERDGPCAPVQQLGLGRRDGPERRRRDQRRRPDDPAVELGLRQLLA